jgi:hypothetical protein
MPAIRDHADLARRIWEDVEGLGFTFVWHVLVSF